MEAPAEAVLVGRARDRRLVMITYNEKVDKKQIEEITFYFSHNTTTFTYHKLSTLFAKIHKNKTLYGPIEIFLDAETLQD